jgi:lipopolysaccharide/colanic/teichoic acid biosynthesis glycosyltransferase
VNPTSALIRLVDIVAALVILTFLAVPMLLIALAIRLYDGGPALFLQSRIGRDMKPFVIFKFRTMRVDLSGTGSGTASPRDDGLAAARQRFRTTIPNDPRITPIGRRLRPSHLDELPQLLNVLKGDMSLVGVRPDTPVQESDYTPQFWRTRHRYRPGLTGTAQIAEGEMTLARRCAEERRWIDNRSLRLYLEVIFGTFAKIKRRDSL